MSPDPAAVLSIELPAWVAEERVACAPKRSEDARMEFVIRLAERNVREGTGGPFGAAVFDARDHLPVAVGVNLVVRSGQSLAHAEVLALGLAQQRVGGFDLSADGVARELVTSCEPCAMCLGAICWSGVSSVVAGARGGDAERIGFDEGPKRSDWIQALGERGISVRAEILREKAAAVLLDYAEREGAIYNPGNPGASRGGAPGR